jgi:hypothetical protein
MTNVSHTYGSIAKKILGILCKLVANEIRIVFDTKVCPLKKSKEIERHNFYSINGLEQQRTIEFSKLLQSDSFKTSFVNFLSEYFENEEFNTIIRKKKFLSQTMRSVFRMKLSDQK